ncbi:MAG: MlaD family protein, partial [Mucispirillum sp.]|nr:MlaD family protein [Mucispirillum sp.]
MADPRFKNLEIKVGLFVVIAVITIIALVIAIGISRDIFTTKVYIGVFTDSGENIAKGMPVKYAGFQIARVGDLQLQDDGRVIMTIGIPTKYVKWIKQDSVFYLNMQNIIGSSFIGITTNLQSDAPNIESGFTARLKRDQG